MVVPRKESWAAKVVLALSPGTWRTYVAHLGRVGVGVNMSKFGIVGGFPCLSHHGSWMRQIRFSGFLANSCNAVIVVAWPHAPFSSCTDPTLWKGILFGHSRHGGVSRGGCSHRIRVVVERSDLDACGAVGVAGLVGCRSWHSRLVGRRRWCLSCRLEWCMGGLSFCGRPHRPRSGTGFCTGRRGVRSPGSSGTGCFFHMRCSRRVGICGCRWSGSVVQCQPSWCCH